MSEFPSIFKTMRHPRKRAISVGPQSAADAYEALAYRRHKRSSESNSSLSATTPAAYAALGEEDKKTREGYISLPATPADVGPTSIGFSTVNGDLPQPSELPSAATSPAWDVGSTVLDEDSAAAQRKSETDAQEAQEDKEMFSRLERPRVRYDVEVVTKLIVYTGASPTSFPCHEGHVIARTQNSHSGAVITGIALLAVEVNPILFEWVGLGMGATGKP